MSRKDPRKFKRKPGAGSAKSKDKAESGKKKSGT